MMSKIEQNSLETQNSLQRDINRLKGHLEFETKRHALKLMDEVLPKAKVQQDVPDAEAMVILSKAGWDEIKDFIRTIRGGELWRFSDFASATNDELKIKEEILKKLTA